MGWLTKRVDDWDAAADELRRRKYGVIETRCGKFSAVHLRQLPKLVAWPEIWPTATDYHAAGEADRCLLYYNQPRRYPKFLALKYIVSTAGTRYATFRAALVQLDQLAQLKGSDALLCDAANSRISERLMARFGWEPHRPQRWHRNYIKRFYGVYPGDQLKTTAGEQVSSGSPVVDELLLANRC